jgi:FHS family L-fucose permease-like MFS transporter
MAVLVYFSRMPALKPAVEQGFTFRKILQGARERPKLLWGAIAMFFYIGADACTAGFFISYLTDPATVGFDAEKAGRFLTYYYIVTTIVGFASIYLFRFFKAGKLVALFATGMVALLLICAFTRSAFNPYAMVGLGAFISILFPTVFSLGIEGLGDFTEKGSALMNIAIVGGAVFPPVQGMVADSFGVQVSYIVPCLCFVCVLAYGIYCSRIRGLAN